MNLYVICKYLDETRNEFVLYEHKNKIKFISNNKLKFNPEPRK